MASKYENLKSELLEIKNFINNFNDKSTTDNSVEDMYKSPKVKKNKAQKVLGLFGSKKIRKDASDSSGDPIILMEELYQLFENIKDLLKKMIDFINKYESEINIDEQDDDDIKFYSSIIINSKNYYIASHKAREKKLLYDLNLILKSMNKHKLSKIYKFNKSSVDILAGSLTKLKDDVNLYKTNLNSGKPKWRKDDRNKQVYTIEIEMRRTFNYHLNINKYFYNSLKNELTFFGIKTKY